LTDVWKLRPKDIGYSKELLGTWWTCWEPVQTLIGTKWEHTLGTTKIQHPHPPENEKNLAQWTYAASPHCVQELIFCLLVFFAIFPQNTGRSMKYGCIPPFCLPPLCENSTWGCNLMIKTRISL
jgi:hypothetical protein